jgi:hypothetical protein
VNPKHLHTPVSTRVRCPVCHQAVYSRAGIHPQCAMRQSDLPKLPKGKVEKAPVPGEPMAEAVEQAGTDLAADPPLAGPSSAPDRDRAVVALHLAPGGDS